MKTPVWKFLGAGAVLMLGLADAQAQRMPQDSWVLSQIWGGSGSADGQFNNIRDVTLGSDGRIYMTDSGNQRIQVFESDGTFVRQWGGEFTNPWGIAVSPSGQVFVVENAGACIQVFESDGTFVRKWGSNGSGEGQFTAPKGIALAPDGRVWVVDSGNNRIQIFETDGTFVRQFGSSGSSAGQFNLPRGIAITPEGMVYVGDTANNRIQVFDLAGTFVRSWGSSIPWDVFVAPDKLVYVAHTGIKVYEQDGTYVHAWSISCYGVAAASDGSIIVVGDDSDDSIKRFSRIYRTAGSERGVPLPIVLSCEQRAGMPYLDVDYTVVDADSPTVSVAVAAFEGGTNTLDRYVQVRTLLEGTETHLGTNILANVTNRISWNVAADWQADYVNLKVRVMANDGRGLMDVGFITLPPSGTNAALTISASPITGGDLLPAWYWLLATGDPAINLSTGKVYGVGGAYNGQLLAQGADTTDAGRAFLFNRIGVREANAVEVARARTGPAGVTNQWTPRITIGPEDRPKAVNEYGFDTGDWGSDAWWVVRD